MQMQLHVQTGGEQTLGISGHGLLPEVPRMRRFDKECRLQPVAAEHPHKESQRLARPFHLAPDWLMDQGRIERRVIESTGQRWLGIDSDDDGGFHPAPDARRCARPWKRCRQSLMMRSSLAIEPAQLWWLSTCARPAAARVRRAAGSPISVSSFSA